MKKSLAFLILFAIVLSFSACGNTTPPAEDSPTTPGYSVALNLSDEWDKYSETSLVQGCLIVRKSFSSEHADALESFLSSYEASINYIKDANNIEAAAQMVVSAKILPNVAVAKEAIPRSNITFMEGAAMKAAAQGFYSALSITSPADDYYYTSSASAATDSTTPIRVGYFAGTTGIGLAKMISDAPANYTFTLYDGPTTIIPAIAKGEIDIAALPTNAAPNVYKQTSQNVQLLAINTNGVLYVCTNGVTIDKLSDLAGKTIYVPEQAPKLVLEYILAQAGISATISMEYNLDTLPNAIAQGIVEIAVLPEPKVTVAGNLYRSTLTTAN